MNKSLPLTNMRGINGWVESLPLTNMRGINGWVESLYPSLKGEGYFSTIDIFAKEVLWKYIYG